MTTEFKSADRKERQEAERLANRWRQIGGVVVDTIHLLENSARINPRGLSAYDADKLENIKRLIPLVASHALQPVLEAINEESLKWKFKYPEDDNA